MNIYIYCEIDIFVYFDVDKRDGPVTLKVGGWLVGQLVGYNIS